MDYAGLGIATAVLLAVTLILAARGGRADVSSATDEVWRFRSPTTSSVAVLAAGVAMILAALWLFLLGKSGALARHTQGRVPDAFGVVAGIAGLVFFGLGVIFVLAVLVASPQHSLIEITLTNETLGVRWGFRRSALVSWDDVIDVTASGVEQSRFNAKLVVVYRTGQRNLSKLQFPYSITRVEPDTLKSIFLARLDSCD